MSEINVNTIKKADGTGSLTVPAETGTVVTTASPSLGRRNLIINGAMQVAQRGTDINNVTSTSYTADRWKLFKIDADQMVLDYDNVSDAPDGFSNSLKITVATAETTVDASEWNMINQPIEGQNLQHLKAGTSSAQDLIVSFWVKSSVTGTYTVSLYCPDFSGSPNRKYYGTTYTIDTADTWEHKTVTISGNTNSGDTIANDNTEGMRVGFMLGAGSNFTSGTSDTWGSADGWAAGINNNFVTTLNATWLITGVQLEVGSVATPFEHRSYGEELALCQRYFQYIPSAERVPAFVGNNSVHVFTQNLLVKPMRATPSLSSSGVLSFDAYYRSGYTQSSTGLFRNSGASNWVIADASNFSGLIAQDNGALYNANISIDAEL